MVLFRRSNLSPASPSPAALASQDPTESQEIHVRRAPGYRVMATEELLALHGDQLRRLKLAHGADRATFERDILGLVRRYADYVNSLPASPSDVFRDPGGLFQLGLEIGFYALQATDGQIFSGRETISRRRDLEPRWRHAAFIAGLCSEIHRALGVLTVTDALGEAWPPFLSPLGTWMRDRHCTRYSLTWTPDAQETRALGLFALREIVPDATMQYLADGNSEIVRHLVSCVSGMPVYREPNVLERIVRRSAALVLDRDLRLQAERDGQTREGAYVSRFILDTMRGLVATDPAWRPNQQKSRVWSDATGVYLIWPNAAADVLAALQAEQLAGMPTTADELREALLREGVVVPASDNAPTWPIQPPASKAILQALKFSSQSALFDPSEDVRAEAATAPLAPVGTSGPESSGETAPVDGATADAVNQQGSLFDDTAANGEPEVVLRAPTSLKPTLRPVLAEIVYTLNQSPGPGDALWTPDGLFIPLTAFESRRVDPALAVRVLSEAGMLVPPARGMAKTVQRDVAGEVLLGVLIHPRFLDRIEGAASANTSREQRHAAPSI